ncbi:hypothetical protein EJ05DRAFT_478497 [Pseudovirgaria hyperparasitica]|uniref:F-box domain-containing protein n=1 Tax=Pseudovirgaria hyperparasitica TaxID=470096 RepID=A0A6A6VYY8_9PEZI|nr:uncharacterized protein EJ05DRAFT_478497 [Pseudovirgaria hyperparasitica]KAF2755503.1 hypothetical protein EJ05DRAFT_478497 [Pseudovirgaria hyperparasitica]
MAYDLDMKSRKERQHQDVSEDANCHDTNLTQSYSDKKSQRQGHIPHSRRSRKMISADQFHADSASYEWTHSPFSTFRSLYPPRNHLTAERRRQIDDFNTSFGGSQTAHSTPTDQYKNSLNAYMLSTYRRFAAFQNEYLWLHDKADCYHCQDILLEHFRSSLRSVESYLDGLILENALDQPYNTDYDIMGLWWSANGKAFEFNKLPTELRAQVFKLCLPHERHGRRLSMHKAGLNNVSALSALGKFLGDGFRSLLLVSKSIQFEVMNIALNAGTWVVTRHHHLLRMQSIFTGFSIRQIVTLELDFDQLLSPGEVFPKVCFDAVAALPLRKVIVKLPSPNDEVILRGGRSYNMPQRPMCYRLHSAWILWAVQPLVRDVPCVQVTGFATKKHLRHFMRTIREHARIVAKAQTVELSHFRYSEEDDMDEGGVSVGLVDEGKADRPLEYVAPREGHRSMRSQPRVHKGVVNEDISARVLKCECTPPCSPESLGQFLEL